LAQIDIDAILLDMSMLINENSYLELLDEIKGRITVAQRNAVLSVNSELITLYWNIGKIINEKSVWGNKFVENLERDLRLAFPDRKGYSLRNLKYMAKFHREYPDEQFVHQVGAQLPWRHHTELMDKIKDKAERMWYMQKTAQHGWSRAVLLHQIELELYQRQVLANKTDNFKLTLPAPQSDLVQQATKDPYIFDFMDAGAEELHETQLEQSLVDNIAKLLLELGTGFAFMGHQRKIVVDDSEFFIDMLFYNTELRCYVVVELKTVEFKPEHAGKLNFYLSAIDAQIKHENDNPTIGILLCKGKNNLVAEYALKDISKPIGVSAYKLLSKVPKELAQILPSAEDIKARIKMD